MEKCNDCSITILFYQNMTTGKKTKTRRNPLLDQQQAFLATLSKVERDNFFCNLKVGPERRAEIWMAQADLGESLVNQHAWATPDDRAIRILQNFSPLVEIGCGANAYWCKAMKAAGIDIVGYDLQPEEGGKINKQHKGGGGFAVKQGGPDVLANFKDRSLFLCYADEDLSPEEYDGNGSEIKPTLGAACLEHFKGEYVIHVGELFGDTTSIEQAPWGRSSSPAFQDRLASEYHCLLKASLTNWLHVRDTISIWKRSATCSIVFAAEGDDDEEEEVKYKHVPVDERLPTDLAAPCVQHLLGNDRSTPVHLDILPYDDDEQGIPTKLVSELSKKTNRKRERNRSNSHGSAKSDASDYACPW